MNKNSYQQKLTQEVQMGKDVFIADTARVLGKVKLGNQVSVWFGAVLRGDLESITIGDRTNIQENCIVHVNYYAPVIIGQDNTIGHGAIIHGAEMGDYNTIGMGAIIMDNVKIGNGCIIGAGTLITERTVIPDGSVVVGSPGKIIRTLPVEAVKESALLGVKGYVEEAARFLGLTK